MILNEISFAFLETFSAFLRSNIKSVNILIYSISYPITMEPG